MLRLCVTLCARLQCSVVKYVCTTHGRVKPGALAALMWAEKGAQNEWVCPNSGRDPKYRGLWPKKCQTQIILREVPRLFAASGNHVLRIHVVSHGIKNKNGPD